MFNDQSMEATMSATLTTPLASIAEAIDVEPVIDLTKSTNPHALLLNVEAELQIMANRERNAARRRRSLADVAEVMVRLGMDYRPGVGWYTPHAAQGVPTEYWGAQCACRTCMPDDRDYLGRVR